jgi:hypothetical protein
LAKLNGVTTIIPAQAERISYNGVEYVRSAEAPVAGDIVRIEDGGIADANRGEYFSAYKAQDGTVTFVDNAGDERWDIGYDHVELAVFKRAIPSADDIVVHNGQRYRKVARKAEKGDLVMAVKDGLGIRAGDVFINEQKFAAGNAAGKRDGSNICEYNAGHERKYYVLEPVESAKSALERLKVGDYAKVTRDIAIMRSFRNLGDIVKITADDGSDVPFNTEGLDGKYTGWADESDLVRATDEEVRAALAEIERKKAEEAAERETERKWAAIGRKPGEIKAGDIVRVTRSLGGHPIGTIGEVVDQPTHWAGDKHIAISVNGVVRDHTSGHELVTPVEQRFDKWTSN